MIGEVFQTGGFGIGLAIGMLAMFVVNIKYRSPILISFTFHLLICTLIMFSYLAHYALSQKITKGIVILYLGIGTQLLTFSLIILATYPIRNFIVDGHPAQRLFPIFTGVLIRSGFYFLFFDMLFSAFIPKYSDICGFLIWYIVTFLLLLFLLRKVSDDMLKKVIRVSDFRPLNIKKQVIKCFIALLLLSTFYEAFRGLWLVWIGTAICLILMFLFLWKIWKHVFDVPKVEDPLIAVSLECLQLS